MPSVSVNVSRTSQNTALALTSGESTSAINKADNILYGSSPNEQSNKPTQLDSEDYNKIGQSQQQINQFASNHNNNQYSIDTSDNPKEFCSAKEAEQNMCENTYNACVENEVLDRGGTVLENISSVPYSVDPSYFGTNAIMSNASSTTSNSSLYASNPNILTTGQIASMEKQKAKVSSSNVMSTKDQNFMVLIKEERVIIDGQYTSEPITIPIYQMPSGGFQFGTQQVFDPVEPRGSQSPMRFYNKNPGRTLSFGIQLHQQEYPTIPLLIIAEALQDLARPYQHTDYSLIPKVVQVLVPGRTFRCYLEAVRVTSQGEDYQSWQNDDIYGVISSANERTRDLFRTYKHNILEGTPELKGISSSTRAKTPITLHYGLSSLSCDLSFVILEEIKLVEYTSNLEFMIIQNEENKLKLNMQYEEALSVVGGDPRDVLVNKITGEVIWPVKDANGEWILEETNALNRDAILASNPNAMTLQQFKNQNDSSTAQNPSPLADLVSDADIVSVASVSEKVNKLLEQQRDNGGTLTNSNGLPQTFTSTDLGNMSEEQINELYQNNVVNPRGEEGKALSRIGSKFLLTKNKDGSGDGASAIDPVIADLFSPKIPNTIDDLKAFISSYVMVVLGIETDLLPTGSNVDKELTPVAYQKSYTVTITTETEGKITVHMIWRLQYPSGIYAIGQYGESSQNYPVLCYSMDGIAKRMDAFKDLARKQNPGASDAKIEELYENLKKATFYANGHNYISFNEIAKDIDVFKTDIKIKDTTGRFVVDLSEIIINDFRQLVSVIKGNVTSFLDDENISRIKEVKTYKGGILDSTLYVPTEKQRLYYRSNSVEKDYAYLLDHKHWVYST